MRPVAVHELHNRHRVREPNREVRLPRRRDHFVVERQLAQPRRRIDDARD